MGRSRTGGSRASGARKKSGENWTSHRSSSSRERRRTGDGVTEGFELTTSSKKWWSSFSISEVLSGLGCWGKQMVLSILPLRLEMGWTNESRRLDVPPCVPWASWGWKVVAETWMGRSVQKSRRVWRPEAKGSVGPRRSRGVRDGEVSPDSSGSRSSTIREASFFPFGVSFSSFGAGKRFLLSFLMRFCCFSST